MKLGDRPLILEASETEMSFAVRSAIGAISVVSLPSPFRPDGQTFRKPSCGTEAKTKVCRQLYAEMAGEQTAQTPSNGSSGASVRRGCYFRISSRKR